MEADIVVHRDTLAGIDAGGQVEHHGAATCRRRVSVVNAGGGERAVDDHIRLACAVDRTGYAGLIELSRQNIGQPDAVGRRFTRGVARLQLEVHHVAGDDDVRRGGAAAAIRLGGCPQQRLPHRDAGTALPPNRRASAVDVSQRRVVCQQYRGLMCKHIFDHTCAVLDHQGVGGRVTCGVVGHIA